MLHFSCFFLNVQKSKFSTKVFILCRRRRLFCFSTAFKIKRAVFFEEIISYKKQSTKFQNHLIQFGRIHTNLYKNKKFTFNTSKKETKRVRNNIKKISEIINCKITSQFLQNTSFFIYLNKIVFCYCILHTIFVSGDTC